MPEATMPPAAKGLDRKDTRLLGVVVLTGDMTGCKSQLTESVVVLALTTYKPLMSCIISHTIQNIYKVSLHIEQYRVT